MSDATQHVKKHDQGPQFQMLSTGVIGRIVPVGASLVDDVVASINDPKVPTFFNEDKGREEENPLDPDYLEELVRTSRRRAIAAMETLLLFGLELEAIPPDDEWLPRLKLMAKRGHITLEGFDLDDPLERELIYKKYIAVGTADLIQIGQQAGLTSRDVEEAARSFKS